MAFVRLDQRLSYLFLCTTPQPRRLLALGGTLLVCLFALVGLLWVGLGTPWDANAQENQMRYLVLVAMAIAEVGGFVTIGAALGEAGELFYGIPRMGYVHVRNVHRQGAQR
jgi:hypothetical protein